MPPTKATRARVIAPSAKNIASLKARAARVSRESTQMVKLNVSVHLPTYEALVKLAEENHAPVSEIVRRLVNVGIPLYGTHVRATHAEQYLRSTPMAREPALFDTSMRRAPHAGPSRADLRRAFDLANEQDESLVRDERANAVAEALAAPMPGAHPLPPPLPPKEPVE